MRTLLSLLLVAGLCATAEARSTYFAVLKEDATEAEVNVVMTWALREGVLKFGKKTQGLVAFGGFKAVTMSLEEEDKARVEELPAVRYVEENTSGRLQQGTERQADAAWWWKQSKGKKRGWGWRWWWGRKVREERLRLPVSDVEFECPDEQTENVTYALAAMTWNPRRPSNETYRHNAKWGAGVDVYVLDSGVNCDHEEFSSGNCMWGINTVDDKLVDDVGHGTHVAATVAGATFGVAKSATVVAVRVAVEGLVDKLGVVEAIQFVVESTQARKRRGVINMSIQFAGSKIVDDAVNAASLAGVVNVAAAGNDEDPSCQYSPSGATSAITVGLHDAHYNPQWSSYGRCVSVYAPGWKVLSADAANNTATRERTGTSMASPHVAALAAVYLTERPEATVASVKAFIVESAHRNLLSPLRETDANLAARIRCKGSRKSRGSIPAVEDRTLCPADVEPTVLEGPSGNDSFVARGTGNDTVSRCWHIKCEGLVRLDLDYKFADAKYFRQYINVTEMKSMVTMTNYGEIEKDRVMHGDVFISFVTIRLEGFSPLDFTYTCSPVTVAQPVVSDEVAHYRYRRSSCNTRSEDTCYGRVLTVSRREREGQLAYLPKGGYAAERDVCWMVRCQKWVKVEPQYVDTEQDFDSIRITDASDYKRVLSGNYSEGDYTVLPETMYFKRYAIVRFSSDESVTGGGFVLKWSCDRDYTPVPPSYPSPVPFPPAPVKTPEPASCPALGCGWVSCDDAIAYSFNKQTCETLTNLMGCDCSNCNCPVRLPMAPCDLVEGNSIVYEQTAEKCWKVECPVNQYAKFEVERFALTWDTMYVSFATEDGVDVLSDGTKDFTFNRIDLSEWNEQVSYIRYRAAFPKPGPSDYGFHFTWTCVDASA